MIGPGSVMFMGPGICVEFWLRQSASFKPLATIRCHPLVVAKFSVVLQPAIKWRVLTRQCVKLILVPELDGFIQMIGPADVIQVFIKSVPHAVMNLTPKQSQATAPTQMLIDEELHVSLVGQGTVDLLAKALAMLVTKT